MCRFSWDLEASASWNPQGLSRPVMELLYFIYSNNFWTKWSVEHIRTLLNSGRILAPKVDQKYLESFEMWCWRRIGEDQLDQSCDKLLYEVKGQRNILHTLTRRKANWIVQKLSSKTCYGVKEETRKWGRSKQLLYEHKEKERYWKLKEEALDRPVWRILFRRGYGLVVGQTTEWRKLACDPLPYHRPT